MFFVVLCLAFLIGLERKIIVFAGPGFYCPSRLICLGCLGIP